MTAPRLVLALLAEAFLAAWPAAARAQPSRYAVVIGNDEGDGKDVPLRYAEKDARKVHDLLVDMVGIPPGNAVLLRGQDADAVQRALIRMNDRIRSDGSPGATMLFVYYSGHADAEGLHPGRRPLPVAVLEQLVRGSPASLRVLVLDSCASGALTRVKGGRRAGAFPVRVDLDQRVNGVVFLTASAQNEDAYESDDIQGSFFTHYWMSALLGAGDADGDGAVTMSESYQYTYDNTLRATSATWTGVQHATFRYELRGQDDLVLTRPGGVRGRATLRFPVGRLYYVFRGGPDGPLVAEVAARDRPAAIRLPAGTYHIRGRDTDFLLEGTVTVQRDSEIDATAGLERTAYARLARKGTGRVTWVHGPEGGYRIRTPLLDGVSPCQGGVLGWGFELRQVTLGAALGLCHEGHENAHLTADTWETDLSVRARRMLDLPWLSLGIGASAGGALFRQKFDSRGVAPDRLTAAGTIGAELALVRDLGAGLFVSVHAEALVYFLTREVDAEGDVNSLFGARFGLALGKRFSVVGRP